MRKSILLVIFLASVLCLNGCAAASPYKDMSTGQLKDELAKEKAQVNENSLEIYQGRGFLGSAISGTVASKKVEVIEAEIKRRGVTTP